MIASSMAGSRGRPPADATGSPPEPPPRPSARAPERAAFDLAISTLPTTQTDRSRLPIRSPAASAHYANRTRPWRDAAHGAWWRHRMRGLLMRTAQELIHHGVPDPASPGAGTLGPGRGLPLRRRRLRASRVRRTSNEWRPAAIDRRLGPHDRQRPRR